MSPQELIAAFLAAAQDDRDSGLDDAGDFYIAVRMSGDWVFLTFGPDNTYCIG